MTSKSDISCELSAGDFLKLIKKAQNVSSAIGLFACRVIQLSLCRLLIFFFKTNVIKKLFHEYQSVKQF